MESPERRASSTDHPLDIPYRDFVLDNGLRVIVHEDRSDPVVCVHIGYHVGSAREELGRSGLAHLFEHLMFEGSEHVAAGEHFKRIQNAGGTLNGATSFDRTVYHETLPSQHLELALWLEADRMGGLLGALNQAKLDNQRDVVKNERRQSYENRPYGLVRETLHAALYPPEHPYSWIPIGSMKDLDAATLDDVRGFFARWYGPNNAVLVVAGDVEFERARELATRHFAPIARGPEVGRPPTAPIRLAADRRAVLEDRVQLPQATICWPTVELGARDVAALRLAAMVLSQNKSAILDRALTVERLLARSVGVSTESLEIAGQFMLSLSAAPRVPLGELETLTRDLIRRVVADGVDPVQLERMKNRTEADHVWGYETVSGKAASLCECAVIGGDPNSAARELEAMLAVTPDDVCDVVRRYLADRPAAILSVVPNGKRELASGARDRAARNAGGARPIDEPAPGARPTLRLPPIWRASIGALDAAGTPWNEIPVSAFQIALQGGRLYESIETAGIAALTAAMVLEGTRSLSTTELTDRLDLLGANLSVASRADELVVGFSGLAKHDDDSLELIEEVIFAPRFAADDFERTRSQTLIQIDTRGDQIRTIAHNVWSRLIEGEDSILGWPAIGTRASLERLTLDDLRAFWRRAVSRSGARLVFAGAADAAETSRLFIEIGARLAMSGDVPLPKWSAPPIVERRSRELFLVDKPGAAQSELRIGHRAVAASDADYFPLAVLNYSLGGAFTSRLNQNLREEKGYTYGVHSEFSGDILPGAFQVATAVHTDATAPALRECVHEIERIRDGVDEHELALAKSALSQSMLRNYETLRARLALVDNASRYGWPDDYPTRRLAWLERATTDELRELARRRVHPDRLAMLVVGDAAKIEASLAEIAPIVRLDLDGRRVD